MRPIAQRLEKRANLLEKIRTCTDQCKKDLLQSEVDEINRELDILVPPKNRGL
jgi:hypothetical protein